MAFKLARVEQKWPWPYNTDLKSINAFLSIIALRRHRTCISPVEMTHDVGHGPRLKVVGWNCTSEILVSGLVAEGKTC